MQRIPIVAALAATVSTVKITQQVEAPSDSATCQDCGSYAATNVVSSIVDGGISVSFDAPVPEDDATIASYNISVLGQGVDATIPCTASPCVVSGIALVHGADYVVNVDPIYSREKTTTTTTTTTETFSVPCDLATTTVQKCTGNESQDLYDMLGTNLRYEDQAALLELMQCPIDFYSEPFCNGFARDGNWPALNLATYFKLDLVAVEMIDYGLDVNQVSTESGRSGYWRPIQWVVCAQEPRMVKVINALVAAGADIDSADIENFEWTPAEQAVYCNNPMTAQVVCDLGADFTIVNSEGENPIQYALNRRNPVIANIYESCEKQ